MATDSYLFEKNYCKDNLLFLYVGQGRATKQPDGWTWTGVSPQPWQAQAGTASQYLAGWTEYAKSNARRPKGRYGVVSLGFQDAVCGMFCTMVIVVGILVRYVLHDFRNVNLDAEAWCSPETNQLDAFSRMIWS